MRRRILLTASILLVAAGCRSSEPKVQPGPDAGELPDSGVLDAGSGPDAGPPARTLVPAHLLGDTPVQNRVIAPHFDPGSGQWFGYDGYSELEMRRQVVAKTPGGLPFLELMPAEGGSRFVVGTVRGGPAPLVASVWIGRDIAAAEEELTMMLYGLGQAEPQDVAFDLVAEPESVQQIERIRWQRYSVRVNEELLGLNALVFSDSGARSIYLNGPTIVTEPVKPLPGAKVAFAARRKPTLGESEAVRRAFEKLRKGRKPSDVPDYGDGPVRVRW